MIQEHEIDEETERLLRLDASPDGFNPILRDQIETSLHAAYAWNAKYAKYGVIWVWFFWVLKWGFGVAAVGAVFGGFVVAISLGPDSPWFLWEAAAVPLTTGHLFFGLMKNGMNASHQLELDLAERYRT